MTAEEMQFSGRWNGGRISTSLGHIYGMSINCRMTFHREETMRTLSTLAMRTLSTLATLILELTFIPIRIAVVESRWVAGHDLGELPDDDIVTLYDSSRASTTCGDSLPYRSFINF